MSSTSVPTPALVKPARVLSAPELFSEVHALEPQVAVFDCDGTLWSGDAGSSFMWWSIENGLLTPEKVAWLRERYDAYVRGEVPEAIICGQMVQVYAGLTAEELKRAATDFFKARIRSGIFVELQQLVAELQERGTEVWAVSSTNDWVIAEGVRGFGIAPERVLAARVACVDGVVTNELVDVPTDEGKVAALHRAGVRAPDAVFGNSVHDAAMLSMARRAFPVNPTPALLERCGTEDWAVYWPASAMRKG